MRNKAEETSSRYKRINPSICLYLSFSFFSPASVEKWNCTWKISSVKDRSSTLDLRIGLVPLWCDSNIFRTHLREITLTQGHSIYLRTVSWYLTKVCCGTLRSLLMFRSSHFLFFVTYGNKVTKIWKYYVIFVYICNAKWARWKKTDIISRM